MIILIILIILVLLSFNLFRNLFKSDTTVLDDVKLKESEPNNNGFALMLQKDDGTYEESNSSTWPTDMKFNSELSGCIDVNGNIIDNALSFDTSTNAVMVRTNKTAYCYVYFDMDKSVNNKVVNSSDIWDMTAEVGIDIMDVQEYRYVGTNPSNYICFGTTDKDTCVNNTATYMYRIIGVFEDTDGSMHTKLIKREALKSRSWSYDWYTDTKWNESGLYNCLYEECFLTNEDYSYMQDSSWTDKITIWNYTMTSTLNQASSGPNYVYKNTGKTIYLHELNRSGKTNQTCYSNASTITECSIGTWDTFSAKISLMYVSDYMLSLGSSSLNYTSDTHYNTLKTGWMNIEHDDTSLSFGTTGPTTYGEWTMTSDGFFQSDIPYSYAVISNNGNSISSAGGQIFAHTWWKTNYYARPVFYLTSDVEYSSGTGTINDPFIIKN